MQGPDAGAQSGGRGKAEHHELLAALAFELQPALAASWPVRRIGLLADDAFEPHPAGLPPHRRGLPYEMVAIAQRVAPVRESCEPPLAIPEDGRAQIPAIQMQKIEQI